MTVMVIGSVVLIGLVLGFFFALHMRSTYERVEVCGHCKHRLGEVKVGEKRVFTCPKCLNLDRGWYFAYVIKGAEYAEKC